jgi:hypothetical protein
MSFLLAIVLGYLFWRERRWRKVHLRTCRQGKGRLTLVGRVVGKPEAQVVGIQASDRFLSALKSLDVSKMEALRVWDKLPAEIQRGELGLQVQTAVKQLGKER